MILYPTSKMIDVFFYTNSRLLQFSFFVLVGFVSAFVLFVRVCCVAYNATDPKILNLATYEGAYIITAKSEILAIQRTPSLDVT